jgi:formiminotetrahydrofolate cyclodeaminase
MTDATTTVEKFLAAAAAKQPAPGGGSVTALVGALAASMGEMAVNYSLGKKGLENFQDDLASARKELLNARKMLLQLVVEDQAAFEALQNAKKMPDGPDRQATLDAAVLACVRIPEAIGAAAVRIIEIVDEQVNAINPYLLSDLAVCADLAMATARCAVYNVRANMPEVKDATDRRTIESTISQILSRAAILIQRVSPRIWARHGQGA